MNDEEYYEVLHQLENCHALFAEFWMIGRFEGVDNESLPTACVRFDQDGHGVLIRVNNRFWASLSSNEKAFVLAHEFSHAYLAHGKRFKQYRDKKTVNWAGDIVINHMLVDGFGFDREDLEFRNLDQKQEDGTVKRGVDRLCWVDTMFPNENLPTHKSTEFYYGALQGKKPKDEEQIVLIGGHGAMGDHNDDDEEIDGNAAQKFIEELTGRMSQQEVQDFDKVLNELLPDEVGKAIAAGAMAGATRKIIQLGKVVKKKTWERCISDILGRFKGSEQKREFDQWARRHRRFTTLDRSLMLPTKHSVDIKIRDRVDVWAFMDTSGSCARYAERFFKAIMTIPEERFHVRGFCFDTSVYEVDFKKGELKGFGGTRFDVIENEIQKIMQKEKVPYPQVVFVTTDGAGNHVSPEYSDRWHWFMTESYTQRLIPKDSKIHLLSDFE
jgi:hypothetical protein